MKSAWKRITTFCVTVCAIGAIGSFVYVPEAEAQPGLTTSVANCLPCNGCPPLGNCNCGC